jgi:tetratricopeptide (TPR) repeat protein
VQARYDLAVEAIKTFYTGVSGDFLPKQDQFKELSDRLLKSASEFYQRPADANPALTDFRDNLARSHIVLGLVFAQEGQPAAAEAEQRAALAIFQKLAGDNSGIAEYRRGMTRSWNNIGDILTAAGRASKAIDCFVQSRDILEALVHDNSSNGDFRSGLAFSLSGLGRAHRRCGQSAAAVADLRRAVALREGLATLSLEVRYDLARDHALRAGLAAEASSGLSSAEGAAEADRAMAVLERVIAEGYRDATIPTEPDLDPLRSRPDFPPLMMDLVFPADPFIPSH